MTIHNNTLYHLKSKCKEYVPQIIVDSVTTFIDLALAMITWDDYTSRLKGLSACDLKI